MPWQEVDIMTLRQDFITEAMHSDANMRRLCRQYHISPTTGYKWLRRYQDEGLQGLKDQSRQPLNSPLKTSASMEADILAVRDTYPAWAGRKIKRYLENRGIEEVPAHSTINAILRRNGRIDPDESRKHCAWIRFEADAPNDLWQMDFKGEFRMENQKNCYPLTILDDHSRYCLCLEACKNQRRDTVKGHLERVFRTHGMPERIISDNGPPWGTYPPGRLTHLGVWLVRLGLIVKHSRRKHPQTLGKLERFHRTLEKEAISQQSSHNLDHAQESFDPWRDIYNHIRPHHALDLDVPAVRYRNSSRCFPEDLLPVEYAEGTQTRSVEKNGIINFKGCKYKVGRALAGFRVGVEPAGHDKIWQVKFLHHKVRKIDLRFEVEL